MKTIAITIDAGMLDRLDRVSGTGPGSARPRSRSRVIREAVGEYVTRLERQAQNEREAAIVRRHRGRIARQALAALREQAKP